MRTSRHDSNRPKLYSAPRRFDLATMLVVTTAYAVLFACMKALNFDVVPFAIIAGFITFVGVAQSLLNHWHRPRLVSCLTGVFVYAAFVVWKYIEAGRNPYFGTMVYGLILSGAFMGYFCGLLVGGVFLISEFLRTTLLGSAPSQEHEQEYAPEESPWTHDEQS